MAKTVTSAGNQTLPSTSKSVSFLINYEAYFQYRVVMAVPSPSQLNDVICYGQVRFLEGPLKCSLCHLGPVLRLFFSVLLRILYRGALPGGKSSRNI